MHTVKCLDIKACGEVLVATPLLSDMNVSNGPGFKVDLMELLSQGNKYILLNLCYVDSIDSSGFGTIIAIFKSVETSKGKFVLCEINDHVLRLFKMTRMDHVFHICRSEKEGISLLESYQKNC